MEYGYALKHSGQANDGLAPLPKPLDGFGIHIVGVALFDDGNSGSSFRAATICNSLAALVAPFS
jgi:hypothetical protein